MNTIKLIDLANANITEIIILSDEEILYLKTNTNFLRCAVYNEDEINVRITHPWALRRIIESIITDARRKKSTS